MSIIVSNTSKLYGTQKALNQVSFELNKGEIVGFLGPNGAGKSTMMKIITAYIPASEGKVEVEGIDVSQDPLKIKAKIGYLAEHNPLYHEMYVKEYLSFIADIHQIQDKKKRIAEIIETVGLGKEKHKKIGALSKGYKQRVGLAQALIHDPEILILDEPTTGLDPNQLDEIRKLIRSIGKQKTVMLSTHIMQEVEAICDRVIIINNGEIVADDDTKNLNKLLQSEEEINVEFEKEISKSALKIIEGVKKCFTEDRKNWLIQHESGIDIRPRIFDLAVKENNSVLTLQKSTAKLEDVFKHLTVKKL